ncbi:uncharacterized protein LOC120679463 isoform X2 [Panicum virgatum]|uniref:Uncharacterized protein n=1 Tax=Panicum virgatum TaxID=38727 RepID=A0A8T0R3S3_PANVG|nr:uncharacterized protein LOC120679463 isoform X2 [Panicum virgatum]KAG2580214.1 hypothetical protein PVAP13_6NG324500 [Panicum virgatum]
MDRGHRAPAAAAALWGHKHLPLLARAGSKESLEYILQALWRTRRTGLDAADRAVARDALQLACDAELDPLLVCLRILIRRCVSEDVSKDDIPKLFPDEVPPELQKLLTLLLQKFQPEWQEDASKDQASAPHNGDTTEQPDVPDAECQLNQNGDTSEHPDVPDAAYQNGTASFQDPIKSGEKVVKKFPLAKDSLDKMLNDLFSTKDQMPVAGSSNGHQEVEGSTSKM